MLNIGKHYVRVECDVHCDWNGDQPPIYRGYVNDELFVERTFIWRDAYLAESLQLQVNPGKYAVKFEVVTPGVGDLRVENLRVTQGPAGIKKGWLLRVSDEDT